MRAPLARNAPPWQHGLVPSQLFMLLATCVAFPSPLQKCPGDTHVAGHGRASVVAARWNLPGQRAPQLHVAEGVLLPQMSSRGYLAESCSQGPYNWTSYLSLKLLGRTFKYVVDLAGAECGCNVAVYFSAMNQKKQVGTCGDYYCDSNQVCGSACSEVDIQEANQHAWHSTLHTWDDGENQGCGLGGNTVPGCSWTPSDYGVGGRCVDTARPFNVAASFPVNSMRLLKGIHVKLSQPGKPCNLEARIDSYMKNGVDGMLALSKVVALGMTPVVSYWSSTKMLWMDGTGMNQKGYCAFETPAICNSAAKVYGFAVEDIPEEGQPACERCPVGHCDQDKDGECRWFAITGVESYHCRVADCDEVPRGFNISDCWKWKGKVYYSINFTDAPCLADPIPQLSDALLQKAKKLEAAAKAKHPKPRTVSTTTGMPSMARLVSPGSSEREVRQRARGKRDVQAIVEHLMNSWLFRGSLSQYHISPFMGILTVGGGTIILLTMLLLLLRVRLKRGSLISAGGDTWLSTDAECAPEKALLGDPRILTRATPVEQH